MSDRRLSPAIHVHGREIPDQQLAALSCARAHFIQVTTTPTGYFDWSHVEPQLAALPPRAVAVPDWEDGLMLRSETLSPKTATGIDAEIALLRKCKARRRSCAFGPYNRPSGRNRYLPEDIAADRTVAGATWALVRHAHFLTVQCYLPAGGTPNNPGYANHILGQAIDVACGKPVHAIVTPRCQDLGLPTDEQQIDWHRQCLQARGLFSGDTSIAGFIVWQEGRWYRLKSLDDPEGPEALADPELRSSIIAAKSVWGDRYRKDQAAIDIDAQADVTRLVNNIRKAIESLK